jgi:hypothetical protein
MNPTKKLLRLFILFSVMFTATKIKADNYYWVGGTGNWSDYVQHWAVSSGGQLYHNHVPTPNDTVIFDSLSFLSVNDTVFADSSILYCHTMKWEQVQGHPVFLNQTLASNSFLKIYGSLQLDTGMIWLYSGNVDFLTADTGQHIKTSGHQFISMRFLGDSLSDIHLDDTLRTLSLYHGGGNLYSDGRTIYVSYFLQSNQQTAVLHLDTSFVYAAHFLIRQVASLFDGDSATIVMNGDSLDGNGLHFRKVLALSPIILGGSNQFDTLVLQANSLLLGSNTIKNFYWRARASLLVLETGTTQTIIDTMIFNGACEGISAIESSFLNYPATILKASGTVFCDRIVLTDIIATGGAGFTANHSVLNGNCAGWSSSNVPSPRNLYWVGNSGNWSDTSHWSLSSGGPGGECAPTPGDNIFADLQSFSPGDTLQDDVAFSTCSDMNWSSSNGYFAAQNSLVDIYGDFIFNSSPGFSSGDLRLRSYSPGKILQPGGNSFGRLLVYGNGGYNLQGALDAGTLLFESGSFNSNTNFISAGYIAGIESPSQTWQFTGSNVVCSTWSMLPSLNFSSPSKITCDIFQDNTTSAYDTLLFPSGARLRSNCSFSDVSVYGNSQIDGNNTFGKLHFLTPGSLLQFEYGATQTILTTLDVQSDCVNMTMLQSTLAGNTTTLLKNGGSVNLNDVILEDVTASGSATFNAVNSVATFNVSGWNVTPPPSLPMYWIGGNGNWNDPQHWSATSGGTPGTCIPNPMTDVYFDANSFTGNTDVVSITTPFNYCHSMDWTGSTGTPSLYSTSSLNTLRIYGSMLLDNNVSANQSLLIFRSHTPGETIKTNGQPLGYVRIDGFGGTWDLLQPLQADSLEIINGTFKTAGEQLNVAILRSDSTATRGLLLDSSVVFAQDWFVRNDNNFTLDAASVHLHISGNYFYGGANRKFREVSFSGPVTIFDADTFGIARFTNMANVKQSCTYDTLFLDNPGYSISFGAGTTQTLNGKFYASANAQQMTGVESSDAASPVSLVKTQDTLCTDFLVLRGMNATGGAVFYAGYYSSDAGNNSGWTFQDCYPQMIDVWPGDANRDLVDNNLDLLAVGLAFGNSKTPRANASNNWTAQPAWIWETLFANASDIVNADCDGNGTIGFSDTTAILLNYGSTHPARLSQPDSSQSSGLPFYFTTPQYFVQPGDTASVGIMLGTGSNMANALYGIAFTLHYSTNSMQAGSAWLEFTNSWLAPTGYVIDLLKDFPSQHKMELAISRIDHQNMSGYGEIARLHFRVDPAAMGVFKCWYTDVTMIDYNETQYPTQNILGVFQIAVGVDEIALPGFNAYPNPTDGNYIINDVKLTGANAIISVMDVSGRALQEIKTNGESSVVLHLEEFPAGTYFVRLENENGVYVERVVKK